MSNTTNDETIVEPSLDPSIDPSIGLDGEPVSTPPEPPNFKFSNKRDLSTIVSVTLPLFFVVSVAIHFHEFVWHAIESNIAINLGIVLASIFGVVLILMRLFFVQQDFRIIERFGYEASQGADMRALLDEPWLQNRYVRHYLNHIANTGGTLSTHMERTSIESELHALQADYDSRLELPQFIVGFMIAMGLLGTFIGLLETLTGISGMLDGMGGSEDVQRQFMKLVVELRKPLAGMGTAFSASMFGLVTSLMLAIMMTNLRRYISRVISLARNVMHELKVVVTPPPIEGRPLTEADFGFPTSATGSSNSGRGDDAAFLASFDLFNKKIDKLVSTLSTHSDNTRKLHDQLGVGPRMKETGEKSLEVLKEIGMSTEDQQKSSRALVDGNLDLVRSVRSLAEQFAKEVEILKEIAITSENQQRSMRAMTDLNTDMVRAIRGLSEQMSAMREVEIGSGRHLNDIKESLSHLSESLSAVDMIATSIGGQNTFLGTLVDESRRTQQQLALIGRSLAAKQ